MSRQRKAALAALGALVLVGVWVDITGYLDVFAQPLATGHAEEVSHYACYAGRIAAALVLLLFPGRIDLSIGKTLPLVLGCMMGGTVLYSFGFYQTLLDPLAVSALGAVLVGIGHIGAVSVIYAYVLRSCSERDALLVVVASQVVERLFVELLELLVPNGVLIGAMYALPIAAAGTLLAADRMFVRYRLSKTGEGVRTKGAAERRYYAALCVMAGVALVACGAMGTAGIWGNAGEGQYVGGPPSLVWALVECLLVVLCCRVTFASGLGKPLALRYQSSLLVLITGFALASAQPMLSVLPDGLVDVLLVVVENYAHVLFWVIALDAARSSVWPVYRAFGLGNLSCAMAGFMWSVFLEHQIVMAESAVFVVFYLLLIACVVYPQVFNRASLRSSSDENAINAFALEGEERLTAGVNGAALQHALEQRCAWVARQHGLSAREGEVLVLLVKGLTRQGICNELHLSEGTVKTHLAHIYEKLGIHSQAELLEIAYDVGDRSR